jgi:hypothetical protein
VSGDPSRIAYVEETTADAGSERRPPPPGRHAVALAALVLGVLVLALQLWLLTVALELYLEGKEGPIWAVAALSALVFAGGLGVLRLLSRRARVSGA